MDRPELRALIKNSGIEKYMRDAGILKLSIDTNDHNETKVELHVKKQGASKQENYNINDYRSKSAQAKSTDQRKDKPKILF